MQRMLILGLGALAVVTAVIVTFTILDNGSETASASTGGPEMVLTIKGGDCNDPVRPTSCDVATGDTFTLSVDALGIPAGGYTLMASAIDLGAKLIYNEDPVPSNDIVWPDAEPAVTTRAFIGDVLVHGSLTGLFPPLPISTYVGNLVEISLTCPAGLISDSPAPLALLPYGDPDAGTSGAAFVEGGTGATIIPKVGSLTINCLAPTPTPTDTPTFTPTDTPTNTPTPTPCPGGICPTDTPTPTAPPADFVVNSTVDANDANQGNGACAAAGGACTLRAAIEEANALPGAQVIDVPSGKYVLAKGTLVISSNLTINGSGTAATAIDGANQFNVLKVAGGTVTISDLTIRNGRDTGDYDVGGVDNHGMLTFNTVAVTNNTSTGEYATAGIDNWGILTLNKSTVTDNQASGPYGVAGIQNPRNVLTLNNSAVTGNTSSANYGVAGIESYQGASIVLNNSTVSNNASTGKYGTGGVETFQYSDLTINNSTVSGNTGYNGAGVKSYQKATSTIRNSTVSGNMAVGPKAYFTGGVANFQFAEMTIENSTISNNSGNVGGVGSDNTATTTLTHTIVANNTGGDCFDFDTGAIASAGYNLDSDGTCGFAATGDISNTDPLLGPLADNGGPTLTHALLLGSPAIDAGSGDCPPPGVDQRGFARAIDGDGDGTATCDIGSVELCAPPNCFPPTATPTPTSTRTPTPTPTPDRTDTDGDHCPDQWEMGNDPTEGGMRDPQDPWDFYDVLGFGGGPPDSVIDLANDIFGVIIHYSPTGYQPGAPALVGSGTYDDFDRGPPDQEDGWPTAPDGVIDLPNDILGIILQHGDDCR